MKAYVPRYSFRPGCPCCNNSTMHGYHGRMNAGKKRAKRSGKKAMRQKYDAYKMVKEEGLV